jgi:L-threonylcarbamoyladenylate synthase
VTRVFEIKARPSFDPLIVHLSEADMLEDVAVAVPDGARTLTHVFWPGPLTLVLPKKGSVPDIVTAGLTSVAVRMPDHPVALELIKRSERPIAAPSANRFGMISPTTAQHVADQLGADISLILDGGPCRIGIESTIVSFATPDPLLLRPGGVSVEEIEAIVGPIRIAEKGEGPVAPGRLPRHYAPFTPLTVVDTLNTVTPAKRTDTALLLVLPLDSRESTDAQGFAHVETLAPSGDLKEAAANLFATMRRLDAGGFAHIYAVAIPEQGLGLAIMDRLRRAQQA